MSLGIHFKDHLIKHSCMSGNFKNKLRQRQSGELLVVIPTGTVSNMYSSGYCDDEKYICLAALKYLQNTLI